MLHEDRCIRCGNCVGNCPFLALKASKTGLGIYIKNPYSESPYILPLLYSADEIENVLTKIHHFFTINKTGKEELYDVIHRIGFESLLKMLN